MSQRAYRSALTARRCGVAAIAFAATSALVACANTSSADAGTPASVLTKVASFEHQVTGVTVSEEGRIFVNFPRWTEDSPVSVAELRNGQLVPYSGARGALVVVDLRSGKARRVLDGHPSTQPDPTVTVTYDGVPLRRPDGRGVEFAADGIALAPDGKTFYWQAIKGKTLYSLPADALADPRQEASLPALIRVVGENGPADGLLIGKRDGRMFVTSPQDDSIKWRDLKATGGPLMLLVRDPRLRWPDTFAEGPDGSIYVTTSHIQDSAFYKLGAPAALPTELWRIAPGKR